MREVTCTTCGKQFQKASWLVREHNFCSNPCRLVWFGSLPQDYQTIVKNFSKNWVKKEPRIISCAKCGKTLPVKEPGLRRTRKFCSRKCSDHRNRRVARICLNCGRDFRVPRSAMTTKGTGEYCSSKCWTSSRAYRQLRAESNRALIKPTKLEKNLEVLLERDYPGEWEYTGDGKVIIDGMIPDFFNKNGRKMVIEAFGRYWHEGNNPKWRRTELGRIMAYNALGIKCLVIWEEELKDEPKVTAKIRTFVTTKSKNPHSHIK